jgi:hypothetical protein
MSSKIKKSGRGGARAGSGRPKRPDNAIVRRFQISVSDSEWIDFTAQDKEAYPADIVTEAIALLKKQLEKVDTKSEI